MAKPLKKLALQSCYLLSRTHQRHGDDGVKTPLIIGQELPDQHAIKRGLHERVAFAMELQPARIALPNGIWKATGAPARPRRDSGAGPGTLAVLGVYANGHENRLSAEELGHEHLVFEVATECRLEAADREHRLAAHRFSEDAPGLRKIVTTLTKGGRSDIARKPARSWDVKDIVFH
jgi:hypothetical protein